MSVKLINQHVNDGSHFPILGIHQAMDATSPVAGERQPSYIVNLVAILFPSSDVDFPTLFACLIQQLQHLVDM